VQVQPLPDIGVTVSPTGGCSTTVCVPTEGAAAEFTVSVHWAPVWPRKKFPVCDLAIVRSGTVIRVVCLPVLFAGVSSAPPDTVAELVSPAGGVTATETVTLIVDSVLTAMGAVRVQVSVGTANVQSAPDRAVTVMPGGGASTTCTVPEAALMPVLRTVSV